MYMNFYFPGKLDREMELAMRYPNAVVTTGEPAVPPPDLTFAAISELRFFLAGLPSNGITGDETAAIAVMSFEICVDVRSSDQSIIDSVPEDNQKCSSLAISLPLI
jgi:hypothetical protein